MLKSPGRTPFLRYGAPLLLFVGLVAAACSSSSTPSSENLGLATSLESTATSRPDPTVTPITDLGPVAQIEAETVDGQQIKMSDFAGNPLVLYFWREHVNGVERELTLMQELYETYAPLGVEFLTVTDREHGLGLRTQSFLDRAGATLPTVVLTHSEFMKSFGFELPPGIALVNSEQRVVWKWNGFAQANQLIPEVVNLAGVQPLPSRHSGSVVIGEGFREEFIPESRSQVYVELDNVLAQLENQPVAIFVWAGGITSEAQQQFIERFVELSEEFKHQSVGFIGLVAQADDRVEQWNVDPADFEFPVVIDEQSRVMIDLGISRFPTTIYLDNLHRVAAVKVGGQDIASARTLVRSLITERIRQGE